MRVARAVHLAADWAAGLVGVLVVFSWFLPAAAAPPSVLDVVTVSDRGEPGGSGGPSGPGLLLGLAAVLHVPPISPRAG